METIHPNQFQSDLTESRLTEIGILLRDTFNEYSNRVKIHIHDDAYIIGTTCFRMAYLKLRDFKQDYYEVVDTSNAITFKIGSIPCRFFSIKDFSNPKSKPKIYLKSQGEQLSLDFVDGNDLTKPNKWRFLIEKPISDEDNEYKVYFVGINPNDEIVSQWCLNDDNRILENLDNILDIDNFIEQDSTDSVDISKKPDEKSSNS